MGVNIPFSLDKNHYSSFFLKHCTSILDAASLTSFSVANISSSTIFSPDEVLSSLAIKSFCLKKKIYSEVFFSLYSTLVIN